MSIVVIYPHTFQSMVCLIPVHMIIEEPVILTLLIKQSEQAIILAGLRFLGLLSQVYS